MSASIAQAAPPRPSTRARLRRDQTQAGLSSADRDHLGERLRAMYEALRDEPLPHDLQELIGRLAQGSPE